MTLFGVRPAVGFACLLLSACVDTSTDRVKLTANIDEVALNVTQGSLVTTLAGSFTLNLELGDLAQQEATVTDPPTFQLVTASDRSTLVNLDALVQGTTFPVKVNVGSHVLLPYVLNDQKVLAADQMTRICAGPVQVACTLKDTSNGDRPLSVDSASLTASGCP